MHKCSRRYQFIIFLRSIMNNSDNQILYNKPMSFYKTSYSTNKQVNFNNFLKDFQEEEKRTNSAINTGKIKMDRFRQLQKPKDNPYLKQNEKKLNNYIPAKPILSKFNKHQPPKFLKQVPHSSQQTSSNFNQNIKQKQIQPKFYQTATYGFLKNDRPMSKQQPRPKGFITKQSLIQQNVEAKSNYIESDAEQFDERDRDLLKDLTDSFFFNQKGDKNERPQTSKGTRRKSNISQYHIEDEQDLLGNDQQKKRLGYNSQLDQFKIPIRSVYIDEKNKKIIHPTSAQVQKQTAKKSKKIDEMIKYNNVTAIKKSSSQMTVPFQTSIDSQFLSLFANSNNH